MKKILLLLFVITHLYGYGQFCAFDHIINIKKSNNTFINNYETIYNMANNQISNNTETYYIPVLFHVVYNSEAQNIADSVIHSQIEVLNEDFRRLNENANNTREIFLEFAGDPNIEFFLADIDPNGNPTDGIIRQYTERSEFVMFENILSNEITLDEVKFSNTGGSDAWNTNEYLNIWVCNIGSLEILPGFDLGQVFGYAYPPINIDEALANISGIVPDWPTDMLSDDENVQGVVLHYTTIGRNNPAANDDDMMENNQGRTAVHEIGHYLGLRHIWGDALFEDGCELDDGISDTPNASDQAGYICDFNKNTCTGDNFGSSAEDLPDMVENYMDYSPDNCLNMFTNGQINVMRNVLEISRNNLINNEASLHMNNAQLNVQRKIKTIDLLAREQNRGNFKIYLYSDGSFKKYITLNE